MKTHSISVKDGTVLMGFLDYEFDTILRDIILELHHNFDIVFTESYRDKLHPNDLHGTEPVRAVDIRSWIYPCPEEIARMINDRWVYDPDREHMKCAIYHDSGRGNHIHLQVHPNTRRRL